MITLDSISRGVLNAKVPARMELVLNEKIEKFLPSGSFLYIDGAHNPHGAKAVASFLKNESKKDGISSYIINGRTKNTNLESFLFELKDVAKCVMAVRVEMEGFPESPYKILCAAESLGIKSFVCNGVKDAIEKIVIIENNLENYEEFDKEIHKNPVRIVICGSFYLARDLKNFLKS